MPVARWALFASLFLGWSLLAPPVAGAARCPKADRDACRACYDAVLTDRCPDAESLVTARQNRIANANVALGTCKAQAPEDAGTCGRTIRWLNGCLRTRQSNVNGAWTLFRQRARARCGRRAVSAANQARSACLRDASCGCAVPVSSALIDAAADSTTTTSTTSTTTTTSASGTTTTTSTTVTTTTTNPPPSSPNGSRCQRQCIARIASNCYTRCQQSCGNSVDALPKCQRACRNRQCTDLRAVCAPNDNTDFDGNNPGRLDPQYFTCCKGPLGDGECELDDADGTACVSTTTTTTTTSTTSTTSTTTTTVTTTTSTTRILGL